MGGEPLLEVVTSLLTGSEWHLPLQAGVPWDQQPSQAGPQTAPHPLSHPVSLPGPPAGPQSYPSTNQAFQPMPVASTVPQYTSPSLYTNPLAQSQQPVQAYAAQHMHHAQSHPPNAWTHQQLHAQGPLGYMPKSPLAMRPLAPAFSLNELQAEWPAT